ncbi:threonylcarbamoyl-AMP synthase [Sphingomonas parva]|uniref:Threonylcarbamoyl-AMP synthase n=1 Tax=Sphingomonas parva TaxID=2555898 RepID=A0A4Y8ZK10_9SPHN|nr:L-threonylcarbamoyladenylate synthase [Sphingomonas parva]TFI56340.1 threonylcarbamoyl-AMP synthase [Sphingomonas parva]
MDRQNDTRLLPFGTAAIAEAARLVIDGWPVAVPTETVYGLAADATSDEAVARIYAAKGRPSFNPLIVHVSGLEEAESIALFGDAARAVAAAFWPGPVTLVLPVRPGARLARAVTAGLPTVAIRCPAHPAMRALLAAAARPLAAPSANASGAISPTRAEHVVKSLGGRIRLVIDGGETALGLESTIVGFPEGRIALLRAGPIPIEAIAAAAGLPQGAAAGGIEAPGQLKSHYAPAKPLRLEAVAPAPDEWLIGFGEVAGDDSLSASGDLEEAAARLFEALHRAEEADRPRIAVAPIPRHGLGAAINDRLARAAAPREADR